MPVRIYDIAKKFGIESKEVLAKAKELGIVAAKVPSSSLDKITAEYLEGHFQSKPPAPPPPAPEPAKPILIISEPPPPPVEPPAPEPTVAETSSTDGAPATEPTTPEITAPPKTPPPPAGPQLGDKIGSIQLPAKPGPRVGDRIGSVSLPPGRGGTDRRPDLARGRTDGRNQRGPQPAPPSQRAGSQPGRSVVPQKPAQPAAPKFVQPTEGEVISLKSPVIVRELADRLRLKPFKLIADLMELGIFANVNQSIDELIAQKVCAKNGFRFEIEKRDHGRAVDLKPDKEVVLDSEDKPEEMILRAPVVTIMGHVDHGKTSLLDVIRKANVAAGEAGGITQHIGAYTISFPHPDKKDKIQQLTFLDTPGHAAFSAMRARGANVTDIVVLVVAANDGVMPQTLEALSHAQAAKVPIIVAVNKCDHPNANPMKVRQQLQEKGLVPDDWGGDTIYADVSALTKQGVDKLLELILLQADLLDLKANPNRRAKGNVIESGLEPGGPTATVLVRKGTLRIGDIVICGRYYGKVRALINEEGKRLKEAGPSVAVKLLGLNGVPEAGIEFSAVENEKNARDLAEKRFEEARLLGQESRSKVTLETLFATLDANASKVLKIVVKADAQGSVEAIVEALKKIEAEKVQIDVIHSAVGTITESDVLLASASDAIILGFHTRIDSSASDVAKREGVQIKLYAIIYELIDQVKEAMAGLLDPILKEVVTGVAEVRKLFELSKGGNVAGCAITSGRITKGKVRVMRRKALVYEGIAQSIRRFQDEVNEVRAGMECGIRIDGFNDFQIGDTIESYAVERIAPKL